MGNYNPDLPHVVGMQWAPLVADQVMLDPATEVGYTFRSATNWKELQVGPDRVRVLVQPPPGQPRQKHVSVNLYNDGAATATGPIRKLVIPCTSGAAVTGAALGGGAGTYQAAVHNPSDAGHVTLTGPNAGARFWFAVTAGHIVAALQYRRILDVTVLYAVTGPFETVPAALTVGLERPAANLNWVMDDTVTGPASPQAGVSVRRAPLGELNPWWSPTNSPASIASRLPFKAIGTPFAPTPTTGLDALAGAGGANINVRLSTSGTVPGGAVFQIHHVALEVTFCEESRIAAGGLDISGGAAQADGGYFFDVPIRQLHNFGFPVSLARGAKYALTVTQAFAGALSLTSPVPVVLNRLGTVGPDPNHEGIVLRKTLREGTAPTREPSPLMPAMVLMGPNGTVETGSHAYTAQAVGTCHQQYALSANSQVLTDAVPGTYVWAVFYARHTPGTVDPLTVAQADLHDESAAVGPSGQISVADFDQLPEVANGWKKVTVRLEPPVILTGDDSPLRFRFSSAGDASAPWQVLGADSNPAAQVSSPASRASFNGESDFARLDNQPDTSADLALSLVRDMDPVTGLTVTSQVQDLAVVDADFCWPGDRVPTGIRYHRLRWDPINSSMVRGWAHYEVQRQDDMYGEAWEVIARVAEPHITSIDDYEARVGVTTRYRIRAVHRTGIGGPWTAPVTATIAAPGVTGRNVDSGVLIMTSNHRPAANLAYVMSWDRRSPEEFTFPEAGQVDLQAMYGRDYRVVMRPVERGGVEFARTVLVNAAAIPAGSLDAGFRQLRDLAWESVPYVCVRDELHHRWLSTVLVPSASVRRRPGRSHLQLAQLTVVEVTSTPAPLDGGPAPCEGLRPEGTQIAKATATTTADTFSSRVGADGFDRQVPAGGWGATQMPGQPWQLLQGAAAALSVSDGAGLIQVVEVTNRNPTFETDTAGWTAFGASAARSTVQAHEGAASLVLTPDGVSETARVQSEAVAGAAPGVDWRATAWVRCAVARPVILSINWFDAAGGYLGTSTGPPETVAANTWTRLTFTAATTIAGAARAAVNVVMTGTPPAAHVLFIDEATIAREPATTRLVTAAPVLADVDIRVRFQVDQMPTGAAIQAGLIARDTSGGDYYRAMMAFRTDGQIGVSLERINAGVRTVLVAEQVQTTTDNTPLRYSPSQWITLRFQVRGQVLIAQAFTDAAPPMNAARAVDDTVTAAGRTGVRTVVLPGNTNWATAVRVDSFEVRSPLGDLDMRMLVRPTTEDVWRLSIEQLALHGRAITSHVEVDVNSLGMCAYLSERLSTEACASGEAMQLNPRQRRWVRCVYEQNIGGGQSRISFFTSLYGTTWAAAGSQTGPAVQASTDPGEFLITASEGVTLSRMQWRDGINGRLLASPDFETQPQGTTEFVDAQGNRWEIHGRGICATA
ncbi:hypothetical protein [Couchioplanes caeruleus]|uniref:Fibronectin type-III domain-containing protein n=2 Tax=Couchioplanes caeruleus TaxID=56438 RepID=A0A1K0FRG7_9ACTN|nr:hypothetical protein [Couchioplanes caeruleus]OJF15385.1 hypothetical protein BG844_04600 [Couchioplanes caeruleus subsp. caeruleus]ROP33424.1 carbohydrate binding protein [Couchioplanes caeruleus]